MKSISIVAIFCLALLVGCKNTADKSSGYGTQLSFGPGEEEKIEEAFLSLKDSTEIFLKEGNYKFQNLSIAQVNNVLIRGAGPTKTKLNFKDQEQGGEGIRVTDVTNFKIQGMEIRDSKGDLLKINNGKDIVISELHAIWSTADSTSGGYGIYPVLCSNVLIENCYAEGASDAGIYVGQTKGAIVRNSKAAKNVAGCEIENSTDAEVYNNEFYDNTAGFLVFDLPDLSQRGGRIKAYNNNIHDNNFRNFAKAGSFGTSWGVGNASPGSGSLFWRLRMSRSMITRSTIITVRPLPSLLDLPWMIRQLRKSMINTLRSLPISRSMATALQWVMNSLNRHSNIGLGS